MNYKEYGKQNRDVIEYSVLIEHPFRNFRAPISGRAALKFRKWVQGNCSASYTVKDDWGQLLTTKGLSVLDSVNWFSSNPSVASVDAKGIVKAKACGISRISAKSGGKNRFG